MDSPWLIVGFAIVCWWASTALVLFLNHLPSRTFPWTFCIATLSVALVLLSTDFNAADRPLDAMVGFCQAILIWAWLELGHFMGLVTGPSKAPCPETVNGAKRFCLGLMTSLYHELLVIGTGLILITLSRGADNPFIAMTFVTLWFMRWSAKLNLFLGVPNVNTQWIPQRVAYLASYIRRRPTNPWFPLFMLVAVAVEIILLMHVSGATDSFSRTGYLLVATLLALAILEHFFMVLSFRESALWDWARRYAKRQY